MKVVPSETSLVVAGAWNLAIVTPEWLMRYGMKQAPGAESLVQASIPTGAGLVFEFPRFSFGGLTTVVRPDALVVAPKDNSQPSFEEIESLAINTLTELPHTPVNGIGHNFEFRDAEPDPKFLSAFTSSQSDLIEAAPEGVTVSASTLITSLQRGEVLINVTRAFDGNQLSVKFNFHHRVTTGAAALSVLRGEAGYQRLASNYQLARDLISRMYGDINDD